MVWVLKFLIAVEGFFWDDIKNKATQNSIHSLTIQNFIHYLHKNSHEVQTQHLHISMRHGGDLKNSSAKISCGILIYHVVKDFMLGCLLRTDLAAARTQQG